MKDWTNLVPSYESQYSASTHTDAEDCVEESLCHIIYMLTGKRYSPRALGYQVDVQPWGSNIINAIQTAETKGLILNELWSTPNSFNWESYYAPIPKEFLGIADFYKIELTTPDLNVSPIWTCLLFPNGAKHLVAQINESQYFDSEIGAAIKPLTYEGAVIVSQNSIKLTPVTIQDWYVKSTGFTEAEMNAFTPEVQAVIRFNDKGGKSIIQNGAILYRDPKFIYP